MLEVTPTIAIPPEELQWSYARSGGPGGQNVNKVASKAVMRWDVANTPSLPPDVRHRLMQLQRRRVTVEGELVISSQRFRDQERNREDCVAKLVEMVRAAADRPTPRKATKPTKSSQRRRLADKRHNSERKAGRKLGDD